MASDERGLPRPRHPRQAPRALRRPGRLVLRLRIRLLGQLCELADGRGRCPSTSTLRRSSPSAASIAGSSGSPLSAALAAAPGDTETPPQRPAPTCAAAACASAPEMTSSEASDGRPGLPVVSLNAAQLNKERVIPQRPTK
jgi:hypothetical protein